MINKTHKSKKAFVVVAMILMIALVAGMGAMTYSKYITSGKTGEQTATAAKWGFVVTVDADELFGTQYKYDSGTTATVTGTGDIVVKASSTAKVVAPGTSGSMTITISGSAEVNAKLTIALAEDTKINEIKYGTYYPIKWTLNDGTTTKEYNTLTAAIGALTTTQVLTAGTEYNKNYTLSWQWAFETVADGTDSNGTGLNGTNRNVEDSLIGYKAAGISWDVINGRYVGGYQLGTADSVYDNYIDADADPAIVTTMSFNLLVSIEQVQA